MLLDEAQILTVMENRRSFKQLKYIVYYLLELYHKKNASRNVNPQPKWWLKSVPFSRPYIGPKDLSPKDAKKALLKIIKSYLTYNGTNMIFRQVYSTALRIRELDDPQQISAKFADINFTYPKSSTVKVKNVVKNKSASKLSVKTVSKNKVKLKNKGHVNNKKSALKSANNKQIKSINKKVRDKIKKESVKQLTKDSTNKKQSSKRRTLLPPDKLKDQEQENKLFIKESDLQQLIPCTSVNLFDVVKYGPVINTKEEFLQQLNLLQKDVLWKLSFLKYKKKLRNTEKDFVKSSASLHTAWPRLDHKNGASNSKTHNNIDPPLIPSKTDKTAKQQETVSVKDEVLVNSIPVTNTLNSVSNKTSHQITKKSPSPKSVKKSPSTKSVKKSPSSKSVKKSPVKTPPLSSKKNKKTLKKSLKTAKKAPPTKTSHLSKKSIKSKKSPRPKKSSKISLPKTSQNTPKSSKKASSSKTLLLKKKINLKLKNLIIKKKKLSQQSNKKPTKAKRSIIKIKWPILKKSPVLIIP